LKALYRCVAVAVSAIAGVAVLFLTPFMMQISLKLYLRMLVDPTEAFGKVIQECCG
jgi:hypothetical protein